MAKLRDDPKLVEKIVKQTVGSPSDGVATGWKQQELARKVQKELERRTAEKKSAALVRELKKRVSRSFELTAGAYEPKVPEGHALVKEKTYRVEDVEMDPAKHAKLKCHAVGVDPAKVVAVELCTDPGSHPNLAAQQTERRSRRSCVSGSRPRRLPGTSGGRSFLRTLLAGKIEKDVVLEACHLALARDSYHGFGYGSHEVACHLLAIEEAEVDALAEKIQGDVEPVDVLAERAAKSGAEKLRVTFAIALAAFEAAEPSDAEYEELLAQLGFKPAVGQ